MHGERGDIVLGWLTKIALIFAVVGVLGFDAVSLAVTNVSATDTATHAASIGAEAFRDSRGDIQQAYEAALKYAEKHGGTIEPKDFEVEDDGTVRVRLRKESGSILLYRTERTKKWTQVTANGRGRAV